MSQAKTSIQSFKRLLAYTSNHKKDFYAGTIYSFLNKTFDIAPEILIGIAIDVVANKEQSFLAKMGFVDPLHQIVLLSILTFFIWAFESLFEYLHLRTWRGLAQNLQHEFRVASYGHIQRLDQAYFENTSSGGLVTIMNDDINQLERFLNGGLNSLIQVFTSVVLIGIVFFVLAPSVAVFAFLPIPIILLGAFYFQRKAAPLYLAVREKAAKIGSRLSNNISGMVTIKSFTTEKYEAERVRFDSEAYVTANAKAIKVSSAFNPLIRMTVLSGFLATFILGGKMALTGELNVGFYGVLVFLTQRLLWPLTGLADTVDLFERAMASADRVLDLLAVPVSIEKDKPKLDFVGKGNIEFKNISFRYDSGLEILSQLNLMVPEGKTYAIVGPTGSGKSTLTKLLLKFYEPFVGEVLIGEHNISDLDTRQLRSQIGLVSQDIFLFDGTIRDNIAYGHPNATDEMIQYAAEKAFAWEFIKVLPQGLNTPIGERGLKLSGGQRQRIAIARVILKNPPVLILDEATSAVDNETESLIKEALAEVCKGRTTLVIAHRLSTVLEADSINVLEKGRIVESGKHDDLLEKKGAYYSLWNAAR